MYLADKQEF